MPLGIGPLELAIVLGIVLIIFGPKRLPGLGKSLGSGMREFKESITGDKKDDDDELTEQGALTRAEAHVEPAATAAPATSTTPPRAPAESGTAGLGEPRS